MGRKHRTGRPPQNDRREANRELRHVHHLSLPKGFGIRRPLSMAMATILMDGARELQLEDDIPSNVELRSSLHATLLPQRMFGRQVLRGLVGGYNVHGMSTKLTRKTEDSNGDIVEADIKGVSVYKGRIINVKLESPVMEAERKKIADVLGALGLRGLHRAQSETVLHMSIGESPHGLTPTEQRHVEHIVLEKIDAIHGVENPLLFEGWDVYPKLDYLQHT